VDGVNLSVERGEFLTLLGPSGSGKTTLLMMVAGFVILDKGRIVLDGQDLMVAVLIEGRVMELLQWGLSAALGIVLLTATLLLVSLVRKFMKIEALFGGR
jgi:ABC-type lipoprotein export system ATPase subunit